MKGVMKALAGLPAVFVITIALQSPAAASDGPAIDPWFARDKYLHGSVSAALAMGGYGAGALASPEPDVRLAIGGGLALTAGIAKELFDLAGAGDASWRDLTWDVMGTASGLAVAWLVDTYVF